MIIKTYPLGDYQANCYIVIDNDTKDSILIDPGAEAKGLINEIERIGCHVKGIFLTHAHFDHVGAVEEIKERYNAKLYVNEGEVQAAKLNSNVYSSLPDDYILIKDGDRLNFNNIKVECIHTPGHSKGGMCFLIGDSVFTGDTLFQGSIGRTDFIGGDFETLIKSIKSKLIILDDDIKVYPGHGPSSTIRYEKMRNPFLR